MEKEKLCLRCMRKIGDSNVCPYCKNEKSEPQEHPFLPLKTVVGGKYLTGKLVSSNGAGSVYYAFDLEKKRPVTMYEFFPKGLVTRGSDNYCLVNVGRASDFIDEKSEFTELWSTLKTVKGYSSLAEVYDVFEDMGTVYAVGEYLGETKTLREYLLETEQGHISWEQARVLLMPVLSGISALHDSGIIHAGISHETLLIDAGGKVKLSGFCIPDGRLKKTVLECELYDGYAAVEQYADEGKPGEYTDIYAFAAVLYRTLIGSTPMSASERYSNDRLMIPAKFAEKLPAYVINALVNALQVLPGDRTESIETFRNELSASPAAVNAANSYSVTNERENAGSDVPSPPPVKTDDEDENREDDEETPDSGKVKKSTIAAFVISVILCAAILISVVVILKQNDSGKPEETKTTLETTSETEKVFEQTTSADNNVVSITLPSFFGKKIDDIKTDSVYKSVLNIETEYVDSDEDKGTVISQSLPEGTNLTSINKRSIKLVVSDGREVPGIDGMKMKDALQTLKDAGFGNVETNQGKIAASEGESLKVYSLVYLDTEKNDWAAIPGDRRLSVSNKLILYYYGEYVVSTEMQTEAFTEEKSARSEQTQTAEDAGTDDIPGENSGEEA